MEDINRSISNYKKSLHETNMFKQMDQQANYNRLKRAQSAYKEKLVDKLFQKGQRAFRINDKYCDQSSVAYHQNMNLRRHLESATQNYIDLEKQHKMDMEAKVVIKKKINMDD